jgi:hypothetical protein
MTLPTNAAFLKLSKRAEANARETLIHTFVDLGPLLVLLNSNDHQILFGRRGTGKTHALSYLASVREKDDDAVVMIDLRSVGSNGGLYVDASRPIQERATGLLIDVLSEIHEGLYQYFVARDHFNLAEVGPALDALAEASSEVRVIGTVEQELTVENRSADSGRSRASASADSSGPRIAITSGAERSSSQAASRTERQSGREELHVNFGSTAAAFRRITGLLGNRRLWVLLDEWSSVPTALQPYLADLLRRSLFPIARTTVKIAAIEQRSEFQLRSDRGDYLGIEVGADASADISLDDFMVFDNNEERAKEFFRNLIARHSTAVALGTDLEQKVSNDPQQLVKQAFTEKRAFEEFVRASEGVPRDAINILGLAAQRALADPISVQHIRVAAKNWYQRDKDKAVASDHRAKDMLHWIIDEVIGGRRARAFLLRTQGERI